MHWFDVDSFVDSVSSVSEGGYCLNTHVKKTLEDQALPERQLSAELAVGAAGPPSLALTHTGYKVGGQRLSFPGLCASQLYS